MSTSHLFAAASGFVASPLLAILLLTLLGEGGMTVPIWLNTCLVVAGALVVGTLSLSRNRPGVRARARRTLIVPRALSDHMRRDIGLDNL